MAEINNKSVSISSGRNGGKRPGAGRKPGSTTKAKLEIEAAAKRHAGDALAALVEIAATGESEGSRVSAAIALLDRGYGKPRQALEHSGKDGGPLIVRVRIEREGRRTTAS